jgi:hypothetical protein
MALSDFPIEDWAVKHNGVVVIPSDSTADFGKIETSAPESINIKT